MHSPLVRPARLIVFHDIAGNYADTHFKTLWDSLKPKYSHRENIADPSGKLGLGVVQE